MIVKVLPLGSWLVAAVLLVFTARRWLWLVVALLPARSEAESAGSKPVWPAVLLLVPLRNEGPELPGLLSALDRLDYPDHCLTIVLIDDGSSDGSQALLQEWVEGRGNRHVLSLHPNRGKAEALNIALRTFAQGEVIVVYDADERPRPDALYHLVLPFSDPKVGGVSGRRAVSNPLASPTASYISFEGLVHQGVTMRAKDRLNLAPAILGANCAYRRLALAQAGNFKPGAFLEDSEVTLKLARIGWKTRFVPEAASYHRVPETISGYWQQHIRWARGFNEVAGAQAGTIILDRQLSPALRLELVAFSLGYLDRLAFLAGAGLLWFKPTRPLLAPLLIWSLVTPLGQIMAALILNREPAAMWRQIFWVPLFFMVDMAMAAAGLGYTLKKSPKVWEERQGRK